ncbi:DUF6274 family protein [Streptomyces sp. G35A]
MAASTRHETRALLRAHLSAASSYRHHTLHCPVCHRLLRLAWDSPPVPGECAGEESVVVVPSCDVGPNARAL